MEEGFAEIQRVNFVFDGSDKDYEEWKKWWIQKKQMHQNKPFILKVYVPDFLIAKDTVVSDLTDAPAFAVKDAIS